MIKPSATPYSLSSSVIKTIPVGAREQLLLRPEALLPVGLAPDGLPLLLHVDRSVDVRRPLAHTLRGLGTLPNAVEAALESLARSLDAYTVGLGVRALDERRYFETQSTVTDLLGETLLARLLGAVSPMVMPEDRRTAKATRAFENSALLSIADLAEVAGERPAAAPVTVGGAARLWLELDGDGILVAPASEPDAPSRLRGARPLVLESLLALRSARYAVAVDHLRSAVDGRLNDARAYRRALARQDAVALGWSVSRVDVGWLLYELARAVDRRWHARERVHADLKPGNVLLRDAEIEAFDALDVAAGATSIGLTVGWSAPEQLLARPVTPASDVYALALMTASLLGAALYGEERTIILPARGDGRRRIRMITDPEVWIDPTVVELPVAARVAWRAFLMRCLAADPNRRPPRGDAFARELKPLLEQHELPGRLTLTCGPGRLHKLVNADEQPAWVLLDRR
ncbi:MAG: hypothetical protein H6713_31960 [Myxococcales bacterium]|nr:hypothetical protein [Myxococcales bacterium]